jgi:galactose mutarotase-like enzyme
MKKFVSDIVISAATTTAASPPLFHQVLISARQGIHIDSWGLSCHELPLETTAAWSVKKYTLHGGKQEGVDVIEVDNGRLRFMVIPTRGMSVLKVESGDVRLGWDSPVKEVVHPQFINLESRGGLGWLEGFNEWMVRCGLEWAGHPGRDRFHNNVGDEVEMDLTLHGKIGNLPASEVEVWIEAGPTPRIHVRGLMEERMFYGPKLSFWADISTELGSNSVRFDDAITNQGAHDQEFQIIYHANFGPPLLGEGARFVGAIDRVTSFNAHAAKSVNTFSDYTGPQPGFIEQVYCLHPLAGSDGRTLILLQNAKGDRAVSLAFPVQQLPYVTLWKNLAAEAEGYVTGLEPGTGFPYTRRLEREAGRVPKLAPNETRRFTIDVAIHPDRPSVEAAGQRVRSIQGDIKTTIDNVQPEPPIPNL